jgi:hypothetical protein
LQSSSTSLETSGTFSARDDNETVVREHSRGPQPSGSSMPDLAYGARRVLLAGRPV